MRISRESWKIGACVTTASVIIGIGWTLNHLKFQNAVVTQTQQQLLTIARTTVSGLEEFFIEYSNALKSISINPLIQEMVAKRITHKESDTDHCPVKDLYEIHRDGVSSLTIFDANGLLLDMHPFIKGMVGVDFSSIPDVASILREHKPCVGDMFYNYLGKPAIAISEPVFHDYAFVGIAQWMIEIDKISEVFFEPARIDGIGHAWVFDDRNILVSHPRKDLVGCSVFEAIKKIHLEMAGGGFDQEGIKEHIKTDHDYLNRVKIEGEGYGTDVNHLSRKNDLIAFKKIPIGKGTWYLIITAPYADIAGPIQENARNTLGLAGLLILFLTAGGLIIFKIQKRKAQLEIETVYLKQLAESAELLRESKEKLAGIIASVPDRISIIDEEYTLVWANQAVMDLFGQEVIGRKCYAAYHRRDRVCEPCLVRECFEDGKIHEQEKEVAQPGQENIHLWFIANVAAYHKDGQPRLVVEVSRDVTQRKSAEELLLRERNKAKKYIDIAGVMLVAIGIDQKVTLINKKGCEILGYREEEIIGQNWFDTFLPEEIRKTVKSVFESLIAGEIEPVEYFENPVLTKTGEQRIIAWHNTVITDEHGEIMATLGSGEDITDRKRIEKEMMRLVTAIGQAAEGIMILAPDWTIQYVNPAFEHMSSYNQKEVIGQNIQIFNGQYDQVFYKALTGIQAGGKAWSGSIVNRKKDGTAIELETTISPIKEKSGNIIDYVIIQHDITHEIIMEKRLRQVQKMEAIGTLAGGIAHDFNNILSAIVGYMELSLDEIPAESAVRDNIFEVLKASHRAAELIKQILTFSRQNESKREPLQLAPIVKEALKLLRASLPSSIQIHQNIAIRSGSVLADPTQIHQVLMNLGINAAYAMRDQGGVLEVNLVEMELGEEVVDGYSDLAPGPYLKVTMKDTGHGIAPENLDRIFDPFFTTKRPNEGTGLGLSVVQGIIKSHGGMITVSSTLGKGSTFCVFLPQIKEKDTQPEGTLDHIPSGRERILLVDDERSLIKVGQRMLKHLGYEVVATISSLDAMEIFCANPEQFDLAIIDQTMPIMSGTDLAKRLMAVRPEIPIILCTGYSEAVNAQKAAEMGIRGFIMKPVDKHTLAKTIRDSLSMR
ncbi:MAG: PAS domain S-box protein [bacterium]